MTDTVKPVLSGHSKRRQKIGFQDQLLLNAGQKYYRMLPLQNAPWEYSVILLTFIKLSLVFKILVPSIFEWPLKTGFTEINKVYFYHPGVKDHLVVFFSISDS